MRINHSNALLVLATLLLVASGSITGRGGMMSLLYTYIAILILTAGAASLRAIRGSTLWRTLRVVSAVGAAVMFIASTAVVVVARTQLAEGSVETVAFGRQIPAAVAVAIATVYGAVVLSLGALPGHLVGNIARRSDALD